MKIYDQPTKTLLNEWAKENLSKNEIFEKSVPVAWFAEHYPRTKKATVGLHVEAMSVNNPTRKHFPNVRPGSGHDLFFKLAPNQFRLWDPASDPAPCYAADFPEKAIERSDDQSADIGPVDPPSRSTQEFAAEQHLQKFLVKNLELIEPGLRLYEDEGIPGVEFPVGGRYVDILGVDKSGAYVVIELKVSRGYDRTVGQILRYMNWIKENMETSIPVRGIIIANEIGPDLRLACSGLPNVSLVEYELSFKLHPL